MAGNHQFRSSTDMSAFAGRNIRPASEVLYNQQSQQQNGQEDATNKLGEQWIQDIEQYETMLEEMAAATLDQDFKDELSAIEQWFRVLSEAERTAATYALIQQTTQMQQRFFAQVLNQMSRSHPITGVLSPSSFGEKGMPNGTSFSSTHFADMNADAMSSRLSDAMSKLNVDSARHSMGGRPPPSPGNKRNSGLDPSTINAMFPDAAAAIALKKAEYAQQAANPSNRNSAAIGDRTSLVTPSISAPTDSLPSHITSSSWRAADPQPPIARPKSSSGQPPPMGQFAQPPPSAGLRSPRPPPSVSSNIQNTTLTAPDTMGSDLPVLSPYNIGNSSWASMSNTPMVPNFNTQQQSVQNDMVANATAMKLAALSTVSNRIALDDVRKYRRARSTEPQPHLQPGMAGVPTNTGIPGANMIVVNDQGQVLNAQQLAALQNQQMAAHNGRRSRPNSPGLAMHGAGMGHLNFSTPQNNGFLAAYDGTSPMMAPNMGNMMGQFGGGTHEGYLSDASEIARGRSPRGRRGSSKPPEDPTDPNLLQDIPTWLRSLRLHKYTDNLKDLKWDELIQLDEKGLEARGVNAQGARNKMLKVCQM